MCCKGFDIESIGLQSTQRAARRYPVGADRSMDAVPQGNLRARRWEPHRIAYFTAQELLKKGFGGIQEPLIDSQEETSIG